MAHLGAGEVGEVAGAGPYVAHVGLAVAVLHPVVAGRALVVDEVALLSLDTRVDHVDSLEVLPVQIVVELCGLREFFGAEGKNLVAVHVVDVHPDDIRGDAEHAQRVGNLADPCVGLIGEAALLIAQGPERGQLHVAGQTGQFGHELLRTVALDDDDAEGGSVAGEDDLVVAAVDGRAPRVVSNDAEGGAVGSETHHPGMALIEV